MRWLALLVLLYAPMARADAGLSIRDCPQSDVIAKIVALEIEDAQATLVCAGDAATIAVDEHRLEISLANTRPEARPRLLALAVAELIATSRLEPPPVVEPRSEPAPTLRSSIWLAGGVSGALWSPLLALGGSYRWLLIDAAFESREHDRAQASVRARVLSLAVAPMWTLLRGRTSIAVGVGLRAGWASLRAHSREENVAGKQLSSAYVAPIARGALAFAVTERWSTSFDLELGYVVKSLRGTDTQGDTLLKIAGLRSSATLGVAIAF